MIKFKSKLKKTNSKMLRDSLETEGLCKDRLNSYSTSWLFPNLTIWRSPAESLFRFQFRSSRPLPPSLKHLWRECCCNPNLLHRVSTNPGAGYYCCPGFRCKKTFRMSQLNQEETAVAFA